MGLFKRHIREIAAFTLIGALLLLIVSGERIQKAPDISDIVWKTYKNTQFRFSIEYPDMWQVAEFPSNEIVPVFNFYKPESTRSEKPPYLNLSSATHVSVYPRGVPVDESAGIMEPSQSMLGVPVSRATDFLLEDGSAWATKAIPTAIPPSWNRSGFVWARLTVGDFSIRCLLEGEPVEASFCKQNGPGQIVYRGQTDARDRVILERMLASFRFINQ